MREKVIHGLSASRKGPCISHLFFADDSLLFCRATIEECCNICDVLMCYESTSGQKINFEKSTIFFNPNTDPTIRDDIMTLLGVRAIETQY